MSGWRHVCAVPPSAFNNGLGVCVAQVAKHPPCGCTQPVPDPASPCGYVYYTDERCGLYRASHAHTTRIHHPHQPTRCLTCGHPVEVVG